MQIKTFEDALSLVPEYWPLVPGMDTWKEGDEYYDDGIRSNGWYVVHDYNVSHLGSVVDSYDIGRRPIPKDVALSEARWILYNALTKSVHTPGFVPEILPHSSNTVLAFEPKNLDGRRVFETREEVYEFSDLIGGQETMGQMLTEGPGALWRWVKDNRE